MEEEGIDEKLRKLEELLTPENIASLTDEELAEVEEMLEKLKEQKN